MDMKEYLKQKKEFYLKKCEVLEKAKEKLLDEAKRDSHSHVACKLANVERWLAKYEAITAFIDQMWMECVHPHLPEKEKKDVFDDLVKYIAIIRVSEFGDGEKSDEHPKERTDEFYESECNKLVKQFCENENETISGEPQAFLPLDHGCILEVTLKRGLSLDKDGYAYLWRVHCSDEAYGNNAYTETRGVIDEAVSIALNGKFVKWAYDVSARSAA